jgi:hypothetical protein
LWSVYHRLGCNDMTFRGFLAELRNQPMSSFNEKTLAKWVPVLDSTLKEIESLVPKDKKALVEEIVQLREENVALREINLELRNTE